MTSGSSFTEFIALALNDTFSYNSDEMAHCLPSLFLTGIQFTVTDPGLSRKVGANPSANLLFLKFLGEKWLAHSPLELASLLGNPGSTVVINK